MGQKTIFPNICIALGFPDVESLLAHARAAHYANRAKPANRQVSERDILGNRQCRNEAQLLRDGNDPRCDRLVRAGEGGGLA